MVREDGGFKEVLRFVIFFDQGDAIPPQPPLNSSPDYNTCWHFLDLLRQQLLRTSHLMFYEQILPMINVLYLFY